MNVAAEIFDPDMVERLAQGLFPLEVTVALAFPWDDPGDLMPQEAACLPRAIDKRLREFAGGRRAARAGMARLGHRPTAILHRSDRAPVWPAGLVGSISHTDAVCLAALTRSGDFAALGLDIEEDADLPDHIRHEVCTPTELAWLSVQPGHQRGRLARLIFCAKECAYKLQYPLTGQMLGFDAFEITPDLQTGQFEATLTRDVAPFAARAHFPGRFAFGANLVMTGMALPLTMVPE